MIPEYFWYLFLYKTFKFIFIFQSSVIGARLFFVNNCLLLNSLSYSYTSNICNMISTNSTFRAFFKFITSWVHDQSSRFLHFSPQSFHLCQLYLIFWQFCIVTAIIKSFQSIKLVFIETCSNTSLVYLTFS